MRWQNKIAVFILSFVLFIAITLLNVPRRLDYSKIRNKVHCEQNASHEEKKYLLFPIITIKEMGFGNQMFEVFALLGMARLLNRTAIFNSDDYLLQSNLHFFSSKLPHVAQKVISIPIDTLESTRHVAPDACCHFDIPSIVKCEQTKYLLFEGYYFQSFKYFSPIESEVRQWLKPSEKKTLELKQAVREEDAPLFKTCVHIRRGDFLTDGVHAGTEKTFTINAIKFLQTLNPGPVFLFGNDPQWAHKEIRDHLDSPDDVTVMETPKNEELEDLFFSQVHCDSVLITASSSTFGWWIGFLSRNPSNVFYRDIRQVDDAVKFEMIEEDFFPPQWKKLQMSENGQVSIAS